MDKNAISLLQEYTMSKFKTTPVYNIIYEKSGTHVNYFKMKVECNNHYAEGEGASKKEARLNAALKMYAKLSGKQNDTKQQLISISVPEILSQDGSGALNTNLSLSPKINYISKLQEYAQIRYGSCPTYYSKNVRGSPHNPIFTIICKYADFVEEAEGSSKKEAKALVAKKMYDRIKFVSQNEVKPSIDLISQGLLDMQLYEKIKLQMSIQRSKVQQLYKSFNFTFNSTINCEKYHTVLKNSFSLEVRLLVLDILEVFFDCTITLDANNLMEKLKLALNILNINLKESFYGVSKHYFIYNLQLETHPVISEMAHGKCVEEAKMKTVERMAETIIIMLM